MDVITPDTVICTLPVTVSDLTAEVEIKTDCTLSCYLPAHVDPEKDIIYSICLTYPSLEAPVTAGTPVGYVAVMWNGKTLGTAPLYTAQDAERSSFVSSLKRIQSLTESRAFISGTIFFCLAFGGWMLVEYLIRRRKRHKWDKYFSTKITPLPQNSFSSNRKQKK